VGKLRHQFRIAEQLPFESVFYRKSGELWVERQRRGRLSIPSGNGIQTRGSETGLAGPKRAGKISQDPDGTLWFLLAINGRIFPMAGAGSAAFANGTWKTYGTEDGLPLNYVIGYFRDSLGNQFAMTPRAWSQARGEKVGPAAKSAASSGGLHSSHGNNVRLASLFAQGERSLLILTNSEWKAFHTRTVLVTPRGMEK